MRAVDGRTVGPAFSTGEAEPNGRCRLRERNARAHEPGRDQLGIDLNGFNVQLKTKDNTDVEVTSGFANAPR
jgi:hypothetical protein